MRKFVAFLMLVLLPLQFSLAVAARYCQHETEPGAAHFGHHEHRHDGQAQAESTATTPDSDSTDTKLPGASDHDCGACHAGCATALPALNRPLAIVAAFTVADFFPPPPASAPAARPERPNWHALV